MKTREEAYTYAEYLLNKPLEEKYEKWHFGRIEIRMLLDFIYEDGLVEVDSELIERGTRSTLTKTGLPFTKVKEFSDNKN